MKKLFLLFLFIPFIFLSCKSLPVNEDKTLLKDFCELDNNSSQLQIYFPEFSDYNGKIIQGDGIVIILPNKKTIVIDGFLKEAEDKYVSFIKSLGITKIDYLIASHYHADHIGTFSKLIQSFEIGSFYSNGVPINTKTSKNLLDFLEKSHIEQKKLTEGEYLFLDEDCRLQIFGPIITKEDVYNAYYNPGRTEKLINSTSLVFKLVYKDFSVLFTGDMYRKGMKKICNKYGNQLCCNVLKLPHHGEWYTTNPPLFIKTVNAEYGIIQDNRYITNMIYFLYKINSRTKILYRTTDGYIQVSSDGKNYNISEETF